MSGLSSSKLRLGIPKGSLEASTLSIFERVGFKFTGSSRSLWLTSTDSEIEPVLLKPQEIPQYVRDGRLDAGLSGRDWIVERDVLEHIRLLAELPFSRQTTRPIRWVLAVPDDSPIRSVDDLRVLAETRRSDSKPIIISTELKRISTMWLARNGIDAIAEFSWGATEAKAGKFADAIIEGTETGASLRANKLREIATIFTSTNQFFANRAVYETPDNWKRKKLEDIRHLINGALRADNLVELHVVSDSDIDLTKILGPGADVVVSVPAGRGTLFSATVVLPRSDVPVVMPAVINQGALSTWVSPMSIYYSTGDAAD